jgi:hypothetical protein
VAVASEKDLDEAACHEQFQSRSRRAVGWQGFRLERSVGHLTAGDEISAEDVVRDPSDGKRRQGSLNMAARIAQLEPARNYHVECGPRHHAELSGA